MKTSDFLRADFYKLKDSKWIWIMPIVLFGLALLICLLDYIAYLELSKLDGYAAENAAAIASMGKSMVFGLPTSLSLHLIVSIAVAIFVSGEFSSGMTKLFVARGANRFGLYASKLIVMACVVVAYNLFQYLIGLILSPIFFGLNDFTALDFGYLVRDFVLSSWIQISIMSVFLMCAYLVRNVGGSIGANIGIIIAAGIIVGSASLTVETSWLREAVNYIPTQLLEYTCGNEPLAVGRLMQIIFVPLAYIGISSAIGISTFVKRDIK